MSQRVGVPTENLVSPELVRRLCWDWEVLPESSVDPVNAVEEYLRVGQARAWQRELVVTILASAVKSSAG